MNRSINRIVWTGLGIALTFLFTTFIAIPIGQFGYVNLGDSAILLFATFLRPLEAFIVGGIASALADLYLGYSHYALFTLVIKGLEGLCVAYLFAKLPHKMKLASYLLGCFILVAGYYFADALLYNSFVVAIAGVGFNFTQGVTSVIVATTVYTLLKNHLPKK